MMSAEVDSEALFHLLRIYPDAGAAFEFCPPKLSEIADIAEIVVDTNVLLLPYRADKTSLDETIRVYTELAAANRLHIPQHVIREFLKHRPEHIAALQQQLLDRSSKVQVPDDVSHAVFRSSAGASELNASLEIAKSLKKKITQQASITRAEMRDWEWSDPVSEAYRTVFNGRILQILINEVTLEDEYVRRAKYKIPPGYKDAGKESNAIGDLYIWHEILELGKAKSNHVIFVSGDEKADWMYRDGENGFLPRFELVDEFRRASSGKGFYIVPLSTMLSLTKAAHEAVTQIKAEEERSNLAGKVLVACPECDLAIEVTLAEAPGSSAQPKCPRCACRFHVHRLKDQITVHKSGTQEPSQGSFELAVLECPVCSLLNSVRISLLPGSTAWCQCSKCGTSFPVHRSKQGSVFCGATGL